MGGGPLAWLAYCAILARSWVKFGPEALNGLQREIEPSVIDELPLIVRTFAATASSDD